MVTAQLVTALLAGVFIYVFLCKVRSKDTIALHRRPENIRRKYWEAADYDTLGVDVDSMYHVPSMSSFSINYKRPVYEYRKLINKINWDDVF